MHDSFRLKHDMGVRALKFCQDNPSDAPRFEEFVRELEKAVTDGSGYVQKFGEGRDTSRSATEEREEQRALILAGIRDIVRIGKPLAKEVPSLKGYFRVGPVGQAIKGLIARGRQYAAKVAEHQDHFRGFAFDEAALAAFTGRLDAFEQNLLRGIEARHAHVGARAEMSKVANRILYFVDCLAAINEPRFAANLEKLAAWRSASKIAWPATKRLPEGKEGTTDTSI